ncbi:TPA: hypothetical protein N0F65_000246 [Lagenidium giganteum]|uniref:FYVE-type domain-containing protein n=1 Tax=Lagenidium giganteum TaxID=4803 RepID=A0AAV2Z8Z3_9STRA|nr:TPA: hypothetical protein N0F65_000246 [Lagenidium giganteum]
MSFPLPRKALPVIEVSDEEREACKATAERMLQQTVQEYERFTMVEQKQVDPNAWKLFTTRDQLKLYKKRRRSKKDGGVRGYSNSSCASFDDMMKSASIMSDMRGSLDSNVSASTASTSAATMAPMLMVGDCVGKVENALYAIVTQSQDELALADIFLHDDVADCAILNTMEGPSEDQPFHFLGYKWFVKRSPTSTHLVKHRDSVYLEYSGLTRTRLGERLGFHIMHSVDLPNFPPMDESQCVRALQSLCFLYTQKQDNLVEVFMMGNVLLSGNIVKPLASLLATDAMLSITRLVDCAEAKRLTKMIRRRKVDDLLHMHRVKANECSLCREKKKLFGSMHECDVCGKVICARCRVHKKVFVGDGILGTFQKVNCCKTCVLVANAPSAPLGPMPTKQSLHSQTRRPGSGSQLRTTPRANASTSSTGRPNGSALLDGPSKSIGRPPKSSSSMTSTFVTSSAPNESIAYLEASDMERLSLVDRQRQSQREQVVEELYTPGAQVTTAGDGNNARPVTAAWNAMPSPQSSARPPTPVQTASAPSSAPRPQSQSDLFLRMLELNKVAESTYHTTKQNEVFLQQQVARRY